MAGSFSTHRHMVTYQALRPLAWGDALLTECGREQDDDDEDDNNQPSQREKEDDEEDQGQQSLELLRQHAVYIDTLSIEQQ